MLVNYKNANMLVVEMGEGKQKLMLVPGINVIDDKVWEGAKSTLDAKVKAGIVVPIYKTTKKDGKEIEEAVQARRHSERQARCRRERNPVRGPGRQVRRSLREGVRPCQGHEPQERHREGTEGPRGQQVITRAKES